jgi:hypothetical protein
LTKKVSRISFSTNFFFLHSQKFRIFSTERQKTMIFHSDFLRESGSFEGVVPVEIPKKTYFQSINQLIKPLRIAGSGCCEDWEQRRDAPLTRRMGGASDAVSGQPF